MKFVKPIVAASALAVASTTTAFAGGLDTAQDTPPLILPDAGQTGSSAGSLGSIGSLGGAAPAIIAAVVIAAAAAASGS